MGKVQMALQTAPKLLKLMLNALNAGVTFRDEALSKTLEGELRKDHSPEALKTLQDILQHPGCQITSLVLENTNIGDAGAMIIAEAIKAGKLHYVYSSSNNISAAGARYIASALVANVSVAHLSVYRELETMD